jgi:hypothetical protein
MCSFSAARGASRSVPVLCSLLVKLMPPDPIGPRLDGEVSGDRSRVARLKVTTPISMVSFVASGPTA